jgi:general nucleoside transport system ATP-binding protein
MKESVLKLEGITKQFGALLANDAITLQLAKGEVLALLGENGAGKTTLMNILFGHYKADAGRVVAFGRELPPGQPSAAIEAGIGMVHQHFALAPNLSVLENILAGTESMGGSDPTGRWHATSCAPCRKNSAWRSIRTLL